jgi:Mn-dependent DtxR family transcriptional regulator
MLLYKKQTITEIKARAKQYQFKKGTFKLSIHESGENYLETIYMLKQSIPEVRSVDVAARLGYTKASISRAMGLLKKAAYIVIDKRGFIQFTQKGLIKVKQIYERHVVLTKFFTRVIGLDETLAETEACKIEHIISPETFDKIKEFTEKIKTD